MRLYKKAPRCLKKRTTWGSLRFAVFGGALRGAVLLARLFALLISNAAGGLACRLAGRLAFAAAAVI